MSALDAGSITNRLCACTIFFHKKPTQIHKHPNSLFLIFIVAPCILKSKVSHLPTDALFITLGKV
jgi:hypothetical protein